MFPPLRFPPAPKGVLPKFTGTSETDIAPPASIHLVTAAAQKPGKVSKTRRRSVPQANDDRRAHILAAAQRVFEAKGLNGANMRSIAREAGYTPGALYFYYSSQEEIYADLLSTSLRSLHAATRDAGSDAADLRERAIARGMAFYDYYASRPDELNLGFYLFKGIGPHGLTRELNERLNSELWSALAGIYEPLVALDRSSEEALADLTSFFGHCVGMLLLVHTGRIRMFRQDGRELFRAFVEDRVRVKP